MRVVGFKLHLSVLFAPKSSQKYKPVTGHVQAKLAGTLLDELEEDSGVELTLLASAEDAGALLAGVSLEATLEAMLAAAELTTLEELEFEVFLSDPLPQAVKAPAMHRLSNSGDVFIISPLLLLILRIVFGGKISRLNRLIFLIYRLFKTH